MRLLSLLAAPTAELPRFPAFLMISLDPSSTCDICSESYSSRRVPYVLPCGHLLCVSCVQRLDPPRCALCRELFRPGHARKIHVEVTQKPRSSSMREIAVDVRRLERRLADAVLDGTQADVLSVFKEVQDWVNTHSDRPPDDRNILKAFAQAAVQSLTIRELITKNYELSVKKIDAEAVARGVQHSLEDKLRDMTNQFQTKRAECEKLELELSTAKAIVRNEGHTVGYMSGPERPGRSRNNTHPPVSSLHHRPSPPTIQPSSSSPPGPSSFHQQMQIQHQVFNPLAAAANANNASASMSTSTAVATTTAKSSRSRQSMPPTSHYQQMSGGSISDNDAARRPPPGIVKQTSHESAIRSSRGATSTSQARPGSYYPSSSQFPHPVPPAQYLPPSHGGTSGGGDKREQPRLRSSHGRSRVRFNLTDNEMQGMQTS